MYMYINVGFVVLLDLLLSTSTSQYLFTHKRDLFTHKRDLLLALTGGGRGKKEKGREEKKV